jgi:hypothetical protein
MMKMSWKGIGVVGLLAAGRDDEHRRDGVVHRSWQE